MARGREEILQWKYRKRIGKAMTSGANEREGGGRGGGEGKGRDGKLER